MRIDAVQVGKQYITRVGDALVLVRVVREEPHTTFSAAGHRTIRAFRLARVDTGAHLSKLRTAQALREVS